MDEETRDEGVIAEPLKKSTKYRYVKVKAKGADYLYLRPPSKTYFVRRKRKGFKDLFASLETENFVYAKLKRDTLMSQWLGEKPASRPRLTIGEVYDKFLEVKRGMVSASALQQYIYPWVKMEPDLKNFLVEQFTIADWKTWVSQLKVKHPEIQTTFNYHKILKGLFVFAKESNLIDEVPKFKNLDKGPKKIRIYPEETVNLVLKNSEGDLHLQILMISTCGIRPMEMNVLQKDRIDIATRMIRLKDTDTKNGKPRDIPMGRLFDAITQKMRLNESPYLFPNPNDHSKSIGPRGHEEPWAELKGNLGVSRRFYDLRHTAATRMLRAGISPLIAARIMGHSITMFYEIYCQPTDQDLENEMAKLTIMLGEG